MQDNEFVRKTISTIIFNLRKDINVDTAKGGYDAIKIYKQTRKSKSEYQMIFMDICMPDLGGIEATEEIRQFENKQQISQCEIIGLSVHSEDDSVILEKCKSVGMTKLLYKPITAEKFKELVTI
jgi:CheY-like chemotaxis protein